jgi:hypothetical protein
VSHQTQAQDVILKEGKKGKNDGFPFRYLPDTTGFLPATRRV